MYFSDEIELVSTAFTQDAIGQDIPTETKKAVFCDLQSISGNDSIRAGQQGIHAEARAIIRAQDYYGHEETVNILNDGPVIRAGKYKVYRSYVNRDTVELYLTESVGYENIG